MSEPLIRYQKTAPAARRPSEPELRQSLVEVGRHLWQKGLVAGLDGNVSARLDRDRFLCTPSGLSKGMMTPGDLVVVDGQGRSVGPPARGGRPPSVEILMHLEAYRLRPDVEAVVHAHPPTAIALSIAGISLAQCLLPDVVLAFGLIPTTAYATPGSAEGAAVIRDLVPRYDALILQRHGSLTVGESVLSAYLKVEKLEQVAVITRTLVTVGGGPLLPPEEIARLVAWREAQGLVRPGQAEDLCRACGVCRAGAHPVGGGAR
jgi:L-fuculose-phosphate aldolase